MTGLRPLLQTYQTLASSRFIVIIVSRKMMMGMPCALIFRRFAMHQRESCRFNLHGTDRVLHIGVPRSKLTALKNICYSMGFSSVNERASWSYKELMIAFTATEKIYLFFNQRGDAVFYSHKISWCRKNIEMKMTIEFSRQLGCQRKIYIPHRKYRNRRINPNALFFFVLM